jgi:hypothetical protein
MQSKQIYTRVMSQFVRYPHNVILLLLSVHPSQQFYFPFSHAGLWFPTQSAIHFPLYDTTNNDTLSLEFSSFPIEWCSQFVHTYQIEFPHFLLSHSSTASAMLCFLFSEHSSPSNFVPKHIIMKYIWLYAVLSKVEMNFIYVLHLACQCENMWMDVFRLHFESMKCLCTRWKEFTEHQKCSTFKLCSIPFLFETETSCYTFPYFRISDSVFNCLWV